MDALDSVRELMDQTRMLVQALMQGENADPALFQGLAQYVYGDHWHEAKIYKITPQQPVGSDIEPLRRSCWELVRHMRCADHGHYPYVMAKESVLFIACCCSPLEREVHGGLKELFEPTENLLDEGYDLQQRGKIGQAIRKYEEVLTIDWENKEIPMFACLNAGNIFYEREQFQAAIRYYKRAVEINSSNSLPYYNLANAFRDIGNLEEAVNEYKTAIGINADDADYHLDLGLVYARIGDRNLAAQEFQKCVEIDPACAPAHYAWGMELRSEGDRAGAVEKFKRAIAINADHAEAYQNWAGVLYEQRDFNGAFDKLREAIRIRPAYFAAYFTWANALRDAGRYEDANQKYERATTLATHLSRTSTGEPGQAEVLFDWGVSLTRQGHRSEANDKFKRAISIRPELADILPR